VCACGCPPTDADRAAGLDTRRGNVSMQPFADGVPEWMPLARQVATARKDLAK